MKTTRIKQLRILISFPHSMHVTMFVFYIIDVDDKTVHTVTMCACCLLNIANGNRKHLIEEQTAVFGWKMHC